jgi:DNA repair exonuclease SbcCD ATPase subunit/Tfp pilus assembly protein PilF
MPRQLLFFTVLCFGLIGIAGAADPSNQFLNAYQSFQQGEKLERQGSNEEALKKYQFAVSLLQEISKNDPSWQKPVVEYRLRKTIESVDRLQGLGSGGGGGDSTIVSQALVDQAVQSDVPAVKGPSITIVPPSGSGAGPSTKKVTLNTPAETRDLRRQINELQRELKEARETLTSQKMRESDLENADWVAKRSELTGQLDVAKRRIADLEHDLKARASWAEDLKTLQKKLDEAVADKLAADEQYQQLARKSADQTASLSAKLHDAQEKVIATAGSKQKIEQLTAEVEKERESLEQLKARAERSEQLAGDSTKKNEELQKQVSKTYGQLENLKKLSLEVAPLQARVKDLESRLKESGSISKNTEADLQVVEEERDGLAEKLVRLSEAAREASKVKGLESQTDELKKQLAAMKGQLSHGEKDLAKARDESEQSKKAAQTAMESEKKLLASSNSDRAVLEEERARLLGKLDQAAQSISTLGQEAAKAAPLLKETEDLKSKIAENQKAIDLANSKIAEGAKIVESNRAEADRKALEANEAKLMLQKQNTSLQEQLKAALERMASQIDHGQDATALQEQLKKLQGQVDLNAKNFADSQQKIADLSKLSADQAKALEENEKSLTDARAQAVSIQGELANANKKVETLQKQSSQGADQLKDLQDQLASKDSQIALLKKKRKAGNSDQQTMDENTLLRGIVLRQIKEEARKEQARRLMEEELKRLNVQSDSLATQIGILSSPNPPLSPEEKSLFKDADLMVSEAAPEKLQASIAAPITQPTNKEKADAAPADKSTKQNPESPEKGTNATGMVWQGKFKELLAQAKEQFDRQDYIQAENTFQEALKISPDDYFALSNIGVVQFQLGKMSEAEESLKKAADKSKDSSFALTTLGIVHYRQQRYDDAERVLRKSISVNDQDFTAHNYLGIVLAASGKGKAGESEIMRAIEINPQYADAHFNLAVIYATGKPPAKMMAKQHYKKALELGSPPDPSLEHLLQ